MLDLFKETVKFLTNRLFIVLIIFGFCFYFLLTQLFELQIVNGEEYRQDFRAVTTDEIAIPATRGTIYDKYGRPLAVNETAFTLKLDPSTDMPDINNTVYDLIKVFEQNGETYIDELPISNDEPYTFEFAGSGTSKKRWLEDMTIPEETDDAETAFRHLRNEVFEIDPNLSNEEARKIVAIRSAIYMRRFKKNEQIVLARNVSQETIAVVEEENEKYSAVYVETDSIRNYPGGITFSHIIGYVGKINESDLSRYEEHGYVPGDLVGKSGLEQSKELELRGTDGKMTVEVDERTRRILSAEEDAVAPIPGDKFFLTIDSDFQNACYEILQDKITEILIGRMTTNISYEKKISVTEVFTSMVDAGTISSKKIWASDDTMYSYKIKEYVRKVLPEGDISSAESIGDIEEVIISGIENRKITNTEILLVMIEQELITADDTLISHIKRGAVSPLQLIIDKLKEGELTPQMLNLDPCSGSVVAVDVSTGDVIAAVSYPTYDNNQMANNFNYYFPIINSDVTSPAYFRAFQERRAPGSTFKMITSIAGLENGVITPTSTIRDEITFTKAGIPYLRCWSSRSHGSINIVQALQVSCNYFFSETAYRMGSFNQGYPDDSINALKEYMVAFGLNDRTGVEIGEAYDSMADAEYRVSSPEYLKWLTGDEDSRWYAGDTVATAIGQARNNYTTANMAKYVATLASEGTRYQMHLVARQEDYFGTTVLETQPNIELEIELSESTLPTVYKGLYNVTHEPGATGYYTFKDFPIDVSGKTGTAQEIDKRNDHTSFGGFAPSNDPQVAIYVMIPFGDTTTVPAAAAQVARDCLGVYFGLDSQPETALPVNALVQ